MRLGVFVAYWPWFSYDEQVALAKRADRLGFDSVWVAEGYGQEAVAILGAPINPSGGLGSKGHPVGATGLGQLVELADQIRGRCGARQVEGAWLGLAENAGGYIGPDAAVASVTILGGVVSTVRVERSGAIARIALNRPERHNAQNPRMWEELRKAGAELAADADVRAAVLTGRGPSFSSGLDLSELQPGGILDTVATAPDGVALIREAQSAFGWIRHAPFSIVAAVHGVAFGAGLQLALACDVRFLAEDATLAMSEVGLGVLPDLGATVDLPALVGTERA